ncbi:Hpt domain-containing protein [Futiania mangrovi]|uniref:Hpt domain-containing protein n=1 Tax=Futiania mangrovi TaxID=2959716 RepID=A0A9J6PEJ3_9PROT|nr:Hpt domain-containing protein [Futiania mangrovii]MCP1336248.1 Hpt domain-containing protein [Futiania mangrovii]
MTQPTDLLDMETIGALQSLQRPGMPSVLGRIVQAFERSGEGLLSSLEAGFSAADAAAVADAAHSLKSGAANAGARSVSEAARKVEAAAREGDLAAAEAAFASICADWPRVLHAFACVLDDGTAARQVG